MFAEGSCRSLQFLKHTAGVDVRHHYRHGCRVDTPILQRRGHFTIGHLGRSTHLGLAGLPWWGGKDYMFHLFFVWSGWSTKSEACKGYVLQTCRRRYHLEFILFPCFQLNQIPWYRAKELQAHMVQPALKLLWASEKIQKLGFGFSSSETWNIWDVMDILMIGW